MASPSSEPAPGSASATAVRLEALLLAALDLLCVTGEEGPIAQWLADGCAAAGADTPIVRIGNSVVAGDLSDPRPLVLLVSHLDVVPPSDADRVPSVQSDYIVGRGSSDMKAGLAVALDVFADQGLRAGWANLVLVGYAGEEGPHDGNELTSVLEQVEELSSARLAIVLEPTDLEIQLGCLGGLHARLSFLGRAAHSARPWHGENALTKAGVFLAELHQRAPENVPADGLDFLEVFSATQAWTSNARNVIPDAFHVNLNYRFSPARSVEAAVFRLEQLVDGRAAVEIIDVAPPAAPRADDDFVRRFVTSTGGAVRPKQAWTDVARFSEAGVPALNFGPGLVSQAHQRGEYVPRANLVRARAALAAFFAEAGAG